ncbi:MAG: hypothetical protein J6B60_06040 [Clostridia bacterium]|nr:hypothetical protein [Clostridia bacterium]
MEEREKPRIFGRIISWVFIIALIAILSVLFLRMCQQDYRAMEDITINDTFKSAYSESKDVRTHPVRDEFSENGGFYAYSLYYIEEAGYVQFCIRYNLNQLDSLKEKYPGFEDVCFVLRDSNDKEYTPTVLGEETKYNYVYIKLEYKFSEGEYSFKEDDLIARMKIEGVDHDFDSEGLNDLIIHKKGEESVAYEFSKKELKELE